MTDFEWIALYFKIEILGPAIAMIIAVTLVLYLIVKEKLKDRKNRRNNNDNKML